MNDMVAPCMSIDEMLGVRDGMIGCARGMLEHLREEATGLDGILGELDLIEVELRLLGARR